MAVSGLRFMLSLLSTLPDILTRGLLEYVTVNHSSLVFTCLDCNKNYEKDFDED